MADKFTKKYIDELSYTGKDKIYQDSSLAGFAVIVRKSGKTYIVNKRVAGKLHRIVISDVSLLTLTEARERAVTIISDLVQGNDPKRKQAQSDKPSSPTLQQAYDYFKEKKHDLKPRTIQTYDRQIEGLLKDWLNTPLNDIDKTMVSDMHTKLSKSSKAQANAAMRALSSVWNYAYHSFLNDNDDPIIKDNPVRILSVKKDWNTIKPRTNYVDDDFLPQFFNAVLKFRSDDFHLGQPHSNNARDILLFFMFSGVRLNEAQTLPWEDVNLGVGRILFRGTKNGSDYDMPMGEIMRAMLKQRYKVKHNSPWVFKSKINDGHVKDMSAEYKNISNSVGIHITPHDLRRTFISVATRLDMSYPVLKRLLNHRDAKATDETTLQYIQISQPQLRDALNAIEQYYCQSIGMTQQEVIDKFFS